MYGHSVPISTSTAMLDAPFDNEDNILRSGSAWMIQAQTFQVFA